MKVRAMIVVEYEINDENLQEAYGTTDPTEILAQEKSLLSGDDGQGDYLHMTLDGADRVVVRSVDVAPDLQIGDLIEDRGYEGPPPGEHAEPSQSEMALGHLFEISMRSWGVGRVVGDPTWSQDNWTLPPKPVYVRAHSLQSALLQASDLPLHVWFETEETD